MACGYAHNIAKYVVLVADAELSALYFQTWMLQVSGVNDAGVSLIDLQIDGNILFFVGERRELLAS